MKQQVVQFGKKKMVGILTWSLEEKTSPVVLMSNVGLNHRVGLSRMWVQCARQLAEMNIPSLRYDLCGLGDSQIDLNTGDQTKRVTEYQIEAMDFVEHCLGKRSFIVIGLCSGADDAWPLVQQDERVRGLVMIDGYGFFTAFSRIINLIHRAKKTAKAWLIFATKVLEIKRWGIFINKLITRQATFPRITVQQEERPFPNPIEAELALIELLNDGRRFQFIYTLDAAHYYNYANQFWDMFPTLRGNKGIDCIYFKKSDHAFMSEVERQKLIQIIVQFTHSFLPTSTSNEYD